MMKMEISQVPTPFGAESVLNGIRAVNWTWPTYRRSGFNLDEGPLLRGRRGFSHRVKLMGGKSIRRVTVTVQTWATVQTSLRVLSMVTFQLIYKTFTDFQERGNGNRNSFHLHATFTLV
ncbi:hypothetical protein LINPERPRIM_LOCUS9184 [Linum perenne]